MRIVCLSVLIIGFSCGGCASKNAIAIESTDAAPNNFTLDLIVRSRTDDVRPGRFVLTPDRVLRHTRRTAYPSPILPDPARTLTGVQFEDVWKNVESLGLTDAELREDPNRQFTAKPGDDGVVYVLSIAAANERWVIVQRDESGGAAQLTDMLSNLAWVTDAPATSTTSAAPRRYDFGPDPYDRYR